MEGIKLSAIQENVESNYAYFPVVFDGYKYTRNEIFEMLSEQGITARKYFYPLTNSFECYRNYPTAGTEKTPVAQHLALRVLTLPLYADLSLEDVDRICDVILGQKDWQERLLLRGLEMDAVAVKTNKFGGGGKKF